MERRDIEKLAELARIRISPEEVESMRQDIDAVLGYVGQIQEVAADLDIDLQIGAVANVMRVDGDPHEPAAHSQSLLDEAPSRDGNYFKVKKILGGNGVA